MQNLLKDELSREILAPESIVDFHLYCTPFWKTGKEKVSGRTSYSLTTPLTGAERFDDVHA
jgi:hypothetical protein